MRRSIRPNRLQRMAARGGGRCSGIRVEVNDDGAGYGIGLQWQGRAALHRHGLRDRSRARRRRRRHRLPLAVPRRERVPHAAPLLPRGPSLLLAPPPPLPRPTYVRLSAHSRFHMKAENAVEYRRWSALREIGPKEVWLHLSS